MPRNSTVSLAPGTWVELTAGDVTNITFQNVGDDDILVKAAVGAVAPADASGSFKYLPAQGEVNGAIAELFPGIAGANRVYAWSESGTRVAVSHA
jgi:hypothetical protein